MDCFSFFDNYSARVACRNEMVELTWFAFKIFEWKSLNRYCKPGTDMYLLHFKNSLIYFFEDAFKGFVRLKV